MTDQDKMDTSEDVKVEGSAGATATANGPNESKTANQESVGSPQLKKLKTESPTPQPIPQLQKSSNTVETKINRPVEEIIDGSDLRKFLNKNLTPYLVRGLNEMTGKWEAGEYESLDNKAVLRKFSEIIRGYADE